jgi:putative endonuclease
VELAETFSWHAPPPFLRGKIGLSIGIRMEDAKEAYVYMLTNDRGNVLYTGCTEDLKNRLYFHQNGMIAGFTKKYHVRRLVYFERHSDMTSARKRERELKGKNRAKKELLIRSMNPTFSELV